MIYTCSFLGNPRVTFLFPSLIKVSPFLPLQCSRSICTFLHLHHFSWRTRTCFQKYSPVPISLLPQNIYTRNYAIGSPRDDDESIFQTLRRRLGFPKTETSKGILRGSGQFLFIKVADEVNYKRFFEVYNLEDTFASWFIVMELHIWLLSCRLMEEGEDGKVARNAMLKSMWRDVDFRSKRLEGALSSARKIQVSELGQEFNTQMISYDEGLLSSDRVLAGALWRRFLQQRPATDQQDFLNQMLSLELLLAFTRSQFAHLHKLSKSDLLDCKFKWIALDKSLIDDK